jgi:outer membrane receptor for ferric coprogen and ferric-rhodotorulic acid
MQVGGRQLDDLIERPQLAIMDYMLGGWTLQLYATNISNKTYVVANTGADVYYGAPRQYGFHGTYAF